MTAHAAGGSAAAPSLARLPWVLLAVVATTTQPTHVSLWLRTPEAER